jgi:hypothetical protein
VRGPRRREGEDVVVGATEREGDESGGEMKLFPARKRDRSFGSRN